MLIRRTDSQGRWVRDRMVRPAEPGIYLGGSTSYRDARAESNGRGGRTTGLDASLGRNVPAGGRQADGGGQRAGSQR